MTRRQPGRGDTVLRLDGITKRFGALVANDAIIASTLQRGEVLGLLGENGAGKTTLMNILFGHYVADAGAIAVVRPAAAAGRSRGVACGRHRHGAPAFHAGRQPDRAGKHRAGHRTPAGGRLAARRGAQAHPASWREDSALRSIPTRASAPVGGRAPAGRDPQGALPRRAHPDPGRTDGGADAAGDPRRCSPRCEALVASGLSIIFISHKLHEVMAIADRVRGAARRQAGGEIATWRAPTAPSWRH